LSNRFFNSLLLMATLFLLSFFVKQLFTPVYVLFWVYLSVCLWDLLFLYLGKGRIDIVRNYPEKLSNGDENLMEIRLTSFYPVKVHARLVEEFTVQVELRNMHYESPLWPNNVKTLQYSVRPTTRGVYTFQRCHVLERHLVLFERNFTLTEPIDISCYPSIIQM